MATTTGGRAPIVLWLRGARWSAWPVHSTGCRGCPFLLYPWRVRYRDQLTSLSGNVSAWRSGDLDAASGCQRDCGPGLPPGEPHRQLINVARLLPNLLLLQRVATSAERDRGIVFSGRAEPGDLTPGSCMEMGPSASVLACRQTRHAFAAPQIGSPTPGDRTTSIAMEASDRAGELPPSAADGVVGVCRSD